MVGKDQVILNSPTNKTTMRMSSVASSVQKKKRAGVRVSFVTSWQESGKREGCFVVLFKEGKKSLYSLRIW